MDQCALGTDGRLKDASEIKWYNDADDVDPIPSKPTGENTGRRPQRNAPLTGKLRDPNNAEKPGLAFQKKAVEQYRAAQTAVSTSGPIPSQATSLRSEQPLPPTTQTKIPPSVTRGVEETASLQPSLEEPLSTGARVAVALKRQFSDVLAQSGDDGEAAGDERERPTKKKGQYLFCG
jgi:hypothetical protein